VPGERLRTEGPRRKFPGVVDDQYDEQHEVGQLGQQEDPDDDHQHHRSHVPLRQAATLRLPVLREQLAAASLRLTHGAHEHSVEYDEDQTGNEVDETTSSAP